MLLNILVSSNIDSKEKEYRKKELLKVYDKMKANNSIDNKYYNISHEIRSLEFLEKYDKLQIAQDHLSKSGCDFKIFENYYVECVCSSTGNEKINGLDKFHGEGVFDYKQKEQIILTRLTQSIKEKMFFYKSHLKNGSIKNEKEQYIIFLGLGNLTYGMFEGTFGFTLNKILFGVGDEAFLINKKTNKIEKRIYLHNLCIYNHNGKEIDCNIFSNENYFCVSAILFATADLTEHYTPNNTFLFINPCAKNKLHVNRFSDLIYWKDKKIGNDYLYFPRYKGRNLIDKL